MNVRQFLRLRPKPTTVTDQDEKTKIVSSVRDLQKRVNLIEQELKLEQRWKTQQQLKFSGHLLFL